MTSIVGWFEIPVKEMERAQTFYKTVFDYEMDIMELAGSPMAMFPWTEGKSTNGGALILENDHSKTGSSGPMIYFTSPSGNCGNELAKVVDAGGKLLLDRTEISENHGFYGVVEDTEGNTFAIHSRE